MGLSPECCRTGTVKAVSLRAAEHWAGPWGPRELTVGSLSVGLTRQRFNTQLQPLASSHTQPGIQGGQPGLPSHSDMAAFMHIRQLVLLPPRRGPFLQDLQDAPQVVRPGCLAGDSELFGAQSPPETLRPVEGTARGPSCPVT